jgi:hypothetical protein
MPEKSGTDAVFCAPFPATASAAGAVWPHAGITTAAAANVSHKPKTGRRSARETRRRSATEHIRVSIYGLAHPTFRVEATLKTTVESARGPGEPEGASLWQNLHENR